MEMLKKLKFPKTISKNRRIVQKKTKIGQLFWQSAVVSTDKGGRENMLKKVAKSRKSSKGGFFDDLFSTFPR